MRTKWFVLWWLYAANGRRLKIKDRQVQYPNRFRLTAVEGQPGVYDLEAVPGVVTEAGTALSKANLLTDATAGLLGLTGDPTIDDALVKLAELPSWRQLGTITTTAAASAISLALDDYLSNYQQLYIYSDAASSGNTAYTLSCYLGSDATGDSICGLQTGSGSSTFVKNYILIPNLSITSAMGQRPYLRKGNTSLDVLSSKVTAANLNYNNLYIQYNGSVTITSGTTVTVWGYR